MSDRVTTAGLKTAFTNVTLAVLYGGFAFRHVRSFQEHPRASVLLLVLFETLLAVFFVVRREATATSSSLSAWVSTLAGTYLPLLLRPDPAGDDLLGAQVVQAVGTAVGVIGLLSLNRSVGLLPAHRGLRFGGAYRIVRHPLYASYLMAHMGYVASNFTLRNVAVAVIAFAAQLARIRAEEEFLSRDPEYIAYRARTRWRLVPFVY